MQPRISCDMRSSGMLFKKPFQIRISIARGQKQKKAIDWKRQKDKPENTEHVFVYAAEVASFAGNGETMSTKQAAKTTCHALIVV